MPSANGAARRQAAGNPPLGSLCESRFGKLSLSATLTHSARIVQASVSDAERYLHKPWEVPSIPLIVWAFPCPAGRSCWGEAVAADNV